MILVGDLISYVYLFLVLGSVIILGTIFYNIIRLSYRPNQTWYFIIPISVLFVICIFMAFFHLNTLGSSLNKQTKTQISPTQKF